MLIFQVHSHLFCSSRLGRDFWELNYHRIAALLSTEPKPVRGTWVWWGKSSGSQVKSYLTPPWEFVSGLRTASHTSGRALKAACSILINKSLPDAIVVHILVDFWLFWGLFHLQVGIQGKVNVCLQILPDLFSIIIRSTQKCPRLLCLLAGRHPQLPG